MPDANDPIDLTDLAALVGNPNSGWTGTAALVLLAEMLTNQTVKINPADIVERTALAAIIGQAVKEAVVVAKDVMVVLTAVRALLP